jgi:hypothetical protein
MDTDNTRGAAEPVAWMVEWTDHADFFLHRPDAEMVAAGDMAVQSLYRSPTLTDEEREAVEYFWTFCDENVVPEIWIQHGASLRGLAQRTK